MGTQGCDLRDAPTIRRRADCAAGCSHGRFAGFTLVELIVAVALLAVLASAGYGGLTRVLAVQAQTELSIERLRRLQVAMEILARDLTSAAPRAAVGVDGVPVVSFSGEPAAFELTRGGVDEPAGRGGAASSGLRRVAYGTTGEGLRRAVWNVLDRAGDTQPMQDRLLLGGASAIQFYYLDAAGGRHRRWPVGGGGPADPSQDERSRSAQGPGELLLPSAVEMTASIADMGTVRRLWLVR